MNVDLHLARIGAIAAALVFTMTAGACDGDLPDAYVGISAEHPTGSPAISAEALVASYDMISMTPGGSLRDFGPHALHGELTPTDVHSFSPVGGARLFRSVDDRVHLPESPAFDLDGPLTIAAWIRVDSLDLHQHVFACDDKWALWITPANQYRLGDTRGGGWSSAEGRVEQGRWASVVVVLGGSKGDPLTGETVALYVDGTLTQADAHMRSAEAEAAGAWSPGDLYATDACYIGFESHQGEPRHQGMPFVGAVADVLIFARAWTDVEVASFARRAEP